jgi:hypothetical protein
VKKWFALWNTTLQLHSIAGQDKRLQNICQNLSKNAVINTIFDLFLIVSNIALFKTFK